MELSFHMIDIDSSVSGAGAYTRLEYGIQKLDGV